MPKRHAKSVHSTPPRAEATAPARPALRVLGGALIIAGLALLAYLPSLKGGFILDDDLLVTDSPLIAAPDGLYRIWCTTEPVDYWPMTNTSFWIEWRLWGLNPVGYHITNLVLHIAAALLIWAILSRLSIPGAWLAALLFAVHPVNVESVAWIAQRKNTLSMLFFLLSVLWYLKAERGAGLRRERSARRRWYALSLLAFTLAMLSKGSVAILPFVLLLLAWWQRGQISRRDLLRTLPFFIVAVALALVNVWFQTHGSDDAIRNVTLTQRLLGAGAVVWFYLYKALVPVNLVFIYPPWNIEVGDWRWWAPLAAAVLVTALLWWKRQSRFGRPLLLGWLFFCVALLPVMGFADVGFMQHSLVADRYQHIAIIGILALMAAGWDLWRQRAQITTRSAAMATAILAACTLAYLSWRQSALYADTVTLYEATLMKNPDSWLLHDNLGNALTKAGRLPEAIEHHQRALRLEPTSWKAHNNLGFALKQSGRLEQAIDQYRQSLQLKPDYATAHNNLGVALKQSGRLEDAIAQYEQALRFKPEYAAAHNNLGNALQSAGRLREAIEHYQQVIHLNPDFSEARFNLGRALAQTGRFQEAIEQYQAALALKNRFQSASVYAGLAMAYAELKQPAESIAAAHQAVDIARATGQPDLARQIQAWLTAYRAGQANPRDRSVPSATTSPVP